MSSQRILDAVSLLFVASVLAACKTSTPAPAQPSEHTLSGLAAQHVVILPTYIVRVAPGLGWTLPRLTDVARAQDADIAAAFDDRGIRSLDLAVGSDSAYRRNPTYATDPYTLAEEPLRSPNLASTSAFRNRSRRNCARWSRSTTTRGSCSRPWSCESRRRRTGGGRGVLRLVLLDARMSIGAMGRRGDQRPGAGVRSRDHGEHRLQAQRRHSRRDIGKLRSSRATGSDRRSATRRVRILAAAGADIEWDTQVAGMAGVARFGDPIPDATLDSIKRTKLALKGPLETPVGEGYPLDQRGVAEDVRSVRQRAARVFDPARRAVRESRSRADPREHRGTVRRRRALHPVGDDPRAAAESMAIITRIGSERIVRYAFEYAVKHSRKKVTLVHKANILKFSQGLFLDTGRMVARDYAGKIEFDERIVDAMAMNLVLHPGALRRHLHDESVRRHSVRSKFRGWSAGSGSRRGRTSGRTARSSRRCTARRRTSPAGALRIRRADPRVVHAARPHRRDRPRASACGARSSRRSARARR